MEKGEGEYDPTFDPLNNQSDFFRMLMSGRICFEREGETAVVAFDMLGRRHAEAILDGDVAGAARMAAVKLAAKVVIEEPEVQFLAAHGINAEPTSFAITQRDLFR
ncbi:hypothetical protein JJQ59_28490 [Cupriavidus necator]|uniref:hypothetical protein n=1 Tax=Cupriavidus necator TaxID=106590 RepID=UPI0011BE8276|nr:hypothetical protein [Cupriavidus necator]QQX86700.1 hypothetical protein JJQ59_28490 [Cupriavidus necator]